MGNVGLGIGARISCIDITAILLEFLHVPQHHRDATQRRSVRAASRANEQENNRINHNTCLDGGEVVLLGRGVDVGHGLSDLDRESWNLRSSSSILVALFGDFQKEARPVPPSAEASKGAPDAARQLPRPTTRMDLLIYIYAATFARSS